MGVNELEIKTRFPDSDLTVPEIVDCIKNQLSRVEEKLEFLESDTDENIQRAIDEIFGKDKKKEKEIIFRSIAGDRVRKEQLMEKYKKRLEESQKDLVEMLKEWEA